MYIGFLWSKTLVAKMYIYFADILEIRAPMKTNNCNDTSDENFPFSTFKKSCSVLTSYITYNKTYYT